ncbi:MAG: CDP-6-deoxy-delta-3,4-glucoseen reductase [Candidatus Competibacteraceae bacterium]|nr:CDP-6-deoxy-delta-3,4-glucoseen reductase [Candidatus Competibacteraceae bacterium]
MSHKITIKRSGHEFFAEAGESILQAALREGHPLPYGCRNGNCGSCIGKVLEGEIRYPGDTPPGIGSREQAEGKALFCQALPITDVVIEAREVNAPRDVEIRTLPARVVGMQRLAPDVMRLYLKLPATERLQFLAGQYVDILLRDGRRRGFSLANAPHNDECLELHVRQVPGGRFTTQVFEQMKEKAILRFQGPLGSFFLREDSLGPIIMMGGGTGFAPLKAILEHAFHIGVSRPIHLYWGARARRDLYLHELPEAWAEQHANFRYTPVLSEPSPEDHWQGCTGFVHQAVLEDYPDLSGHEIYMSGPPPMIEAAKEGFLTRGLPEEHLYYDSFEFSVDAPGEKKG